MKKNNKLETAYNKVFKVVKELDTDEMNTLLDAICTGWEAWRSLSALREKPAIEKEDSIDRIDNDLEKKTRKKK